MKKHEMVLDFTSLLDVILIILFLVLCSMNGKAQKDAETIEELEKAKVEYEALTAEQRAEIAKLELSNTELEEKLQQAQQELAELKKQYAELVDENEHNKAIAIQAQETLKKYIDIGGFGKFDSALFGVFKESTLLIELHVTQMTNNNTLVILKRNNNRIREVDFYAGKSSRDPYLDEPGQIYFDDVYEKNKKAIIDMTTAGLAGYVKEEKYKIIMVAVTYGADDTFDEYGLKTVLDALSDLKDDENKEYYLIPADFGQALSGM